MDAASAPEESAAPDPAPVVVEVRDLTKTFRIPEHRVDSLKERAVHPFRRNSYRELKALDGVNFEVRQGEFFGIAGRNGSGKSTLLKLLAGIYSRESGSIRVAGKLAPFIELGVGFNPDLNARENIILNGVMMGLARADAESKVEGVLQFAELEEFAELKLKNYSSGMMVRLAFSTMLEAEVDVLLIDEVLAVGDAAFVQKCNDAFDDMRSAGKTVILVTHDMDSIERLCDRAMLLDNGRIGMIGDPAEVGHQYMRLNFDEAADAHDLSEPSRERAVRFTGAWLEDAAGNTIKNAGQGDRVRAVVEIEARDEIERPQIEGVVADVDDNHVLGFRQHLQVDGVEIERLEPGQKLQVGLAFENVLRPGHYSGSFRLCRNWNEGDIAGQMIGAIDFLVYTSGSRPGLVAIEMEQSTRIERPGDRSEGS